MKSIFSGLGFSNGPHQQIYRPYLVEFIPRYQKIKTIPTHPIR